MALDVYFRDDIRNILRSVYVASEGPTALVAELLQDPELKNVPITKLLAIYRTGYQQALNAVGIAFGLNDLPEPQIALVQNTHPVNSAAELPATNSAREDDPKLDDLVMTRFLWIKRQHERRE